MKVVHITPTYFDNASIIGGGERYPTELSTWMANQVDTTLVSFSSKRQSSQQGKLKIEVYPVKYFIHGSKVNPLSFRYLTEIFAADIVHIHNINTVASDLGCLVASALGKRVFVTDYGGGGSLVLNHKLPIFQQYRHAVTYSRFGLDFIPPELQKKAVLIKGGIDTDKFCPDPSVSKENKILYVGRILPHKGIDYLIDGFRLLNRPDYKLTIIGRVYHEAYYQMLKEAAENLSIEFVHDADDQRLLHEYRTAKVTVLPSVHTTCYGDHTPIPELMGFTLLESQACGTPAICTNAGAMHEFIDDGKTGFIVKQNSGEDISKALCQLVGLSNPDYAEYQTRSREWTECLSWSTVVSAHLELYSN